MTLRNISARVCLENAFIRCAHKSHAEWGMQAAGVVFRTRSGKQGESVPFYPEGGIRLWLSLN